MIKPVALLFAAFVLVALSLPASEVILKRKAKELSRQNANRPIEPPPQSAARPAAPAAQPGQPVSRPPARQTNPAQAQNVQKLVADLAIIKSKSQVTTDQKQKLAQDLQACAQGATKPSQEAVNKLANDVASAITDKKLSTQEQAQLAKDIATVLNSANISQAETLAVIMSAQTILKSSGVTQQDVQTIVADLRAIAAEVQKNPGSARR